MSQDIPLVDLEAQYATIAPEIDEAIRRVLESHAFINGPEVLQFETDFAAWLQGADSGETPDASPEESDGWDDEDEDEIHVIGCSSGTTALHLLFAAHDIGPGDEVIVPSHTFIATIEGVIHAGATPVFAEIDPATFCMHPIAAEAMITPRTRAICPVHLYGRMADMAGFRELCDRMGLLLFEDAAQAHGARIPSDGASANGRKNTAAGTIADGGTFSFFPGKNLGAYGDAGAVVVPSRKKADRIRALANHGRAAKYAHDVIGYNYRMDGIQAAVLGVKLRRLAAWTEERRAAAARYSEMLAGFPGVTPPAMDAGEGHAWHLYVIRVGEPPRLGDERDYAAIIRDLAEHRDALLQHLHANGIRAGVHYPIPCHLQPALSAHFQAEPGLLQATEIAAAQIISLPLYPEITAEQQERVVDVIKSFEQ